MSQTLVTTNVIDISYRCDQDGNYFVIISFDHPDAEPIEYPVVESVVNHEKLVF